MIVTINNIRAYGYCSKGAREFFKSHQLNWQDFLDNGIEAEKLLATNNAMAISLVKYLQGEISHGLE